MVAADTKARFLQDAERFVLQGKAQQAIDEYLKIVKGDPNDVLILNTIGDLYLRQRNVPEANRCFSQVAESYVRDNFLSKAIAVYKKILSTDPGDIDINLTVASLYAKQGSTVEARNQFLRIASLFEKEGKSKESLEAYEKVVELDPANAAIQRKLAELQSAAGAKDKAHYHWTGAARALVKAGDLTGALDCFGRAMRLKPLDVETMRGFLDCCLAMGNVAPALEQLEKSLAVAPENLDLREILGRTYLATNNPEKAAKAFEIVVSMDESRYQDFFSLSQAFVDAGAYDRAATCLESIFPILISRRETARAVKIYETILERYPTHVLSLIKLASLHSATDDQGRYLEALDKISEFYLERKSPVEAIEYLEKILQSFPESEKHQRLHRQAFSEAYPNSPYRAPVPEPRSPAEFTSAISTRGSAAEGEDRSSSIVDVDLLLNYGLREKALSLLRSMETRNPSDKEVRMRLLAVFKNEKKYAEAAEQCLLLAVLHRKRNDEESAQKYLAEAGQLSPDAVECEQDIDDFARRNGIVTEVPVGSAGIAADLKADEEVDLSGDLLEIFLTGDQGNTAYEDPELESVQEAVTETSTRNSPPQTPPKSIHEQLQEVDFYIRLGFHDEALAKLNEIRKIYPRNPELADRYQKMGVTPPAPGTPTAEISFPGASGAAEPARAVPPEQAGTFQEPEITDELERVMERRAEPLPPIFMPEKSAGYSSPQSRPRPQATQSESDIIRGATFTAKSAPSYRPEQAQMRDRFQAAAPQSDFEVNEMFADLLDEVSSLTDQDIAKETFEEHFSLGTAYREMELMEEAITEFQHALKSLDLQRDARRIVQCCGMLSTCFLKKGMPRSAVRWCQMGLSVSDISSHESMALRYDMAVAHSMAGSNEEALECFDSIFGVDPGYRDVAKRMDELRACQ
jgi:tetratricopeptide (TPR) repeat protein